MGKGIKNAPIKFEVIPLGNVRGGAPTDNGIARIRFSTPSRRIHWTLQIGWVGNPSFTTKLWSLYPVMVDPFNGSQMTHLQSVKSAATLPDGYEAESGIKQWEAEINFAVDTSDEARMYAVMIWEPSLVEMCEEERAYWAGLCSASRVTPLLDIGTSL